MNENRFPQNLIDYFKRYSYAELSLMIQAQQSNFATISIGEEAINPGWGNSMQIWSDGVRIAIDGLFEGATEPPSDDLTTPPIEALGRNNVGAINFVIDYFGIKNSKDIDEVGSVGSIVLVFAKYVMWSK